MKAPTVLKAPCAKCPFRSDVPIYLRAGRREDIARGLQWARDIVWRESRNTPTAANPRSTARGCGQMLLSLHGWRFTAVGCTPAQWADPDCNVKAMLHLYREAGTSPWSL